MNRWRRALWTRYYEWLYRSRRDEGVCCCGSLMDSHTIWDGHPPTSAYDYAVYCAVKRRMGGRL